MVINPVYLMLYTYLLANTYAFLNLQLNKGFFAYGEFYQISQIGSLVVYVYQLLFLSFIFIFFRQHSLKNYKIRTLNNRWGVGLIFITILFFLFNRITGAGLAGTEFSFNASNPINIFFVLTQPDLLFLLIAPFLASSRLFWVVTIIYFFSMLSRGWMGSVLIVFLIYLIRYYPVHVKLKSLIYFISLVLIVFLLLPILDALKWGMRLGLSVSDIFKQVFNSNYWEVLFTVLDSVVSRFQNINYAAYTLENREFFLKSLLNGDFSWFFQNGIFYSIFCKISECPIDFNVFAAEKIYGAVGLSWNIDPGLSGWSSIFGFFSILFIGFSAFFLWILFHFFAKVYGNKGILLISVFSLMYFYHGWLNAFFNMIIYGFFLYFLFRLKSFKF